MNYLFSLLLFISLKNFAQVDSLKNIDAFSHFPGGENALNEFLKKNVKYPEEAFEFSEQGKVYFKCKVLKDGSLSEIRIIRGVTSSLDKEANRLVKLMPNWIPFEKDGKIIEPYIQFPIIFRLE